MPARYAVISFLILQSAISLGLSGLSTPTQAQTVTPSAVTPSLPGRPLWSDLTEAQQQALAPLSEQWPTMNEPHKRKWLALSQNFSQLSADEQNTLQSRMREWAGLSPQKRAVARLNFADAKKLPQEDKKAKWEAYQALSPEAKQKLAAQQTRPVMGAAPVTKPPNNKLVSPPPASGNKPLPRIDTQQLAPVTLLPAALPSVAPATTPAASSDSPEAATQ